MTTELYEQVDRGARLLDAEMPDWYTKINIDALQMHNSCLCVLGQLYGGNYTRGRQALGVEAGQSSAYGFNADQSLYKRLKEEWVMEIVLRKMEAGQWTRLEEMAVV